METECSWMLVGMVSSRNCCKKNAKCSSLAAQATWIFCESTEMNTKFVWCNGNDAEACLIHREGYAKPTIQSTQSSSVANSSSFLVQGCESREFHEGNLSLSSSAILVLDKTHLPLSSNQPSPVRIPHFSITKSCQVIISSNRQFKSHRTTSQNFFPFTNKKKVIVEKIAETATNKNIHFKFLGRESVKVRCVICSSYRSTLSMCCDTRLKC
jgi:hypothetical protein